MISKNFFGYLLFPSLFWSLLLVSVFASAQGNSVQINGPDVVLIEDKDRRIYEYRQNGVVQLIKVVPIIGPPYYLRPAKRLRHNNKLLQDDLLLPEWRIINF